MIGIAQNLFNEFIEHEYVEHRNVSLPPNSTFVLTQSTRKIIITPPLLLPKTGRLKKNQCAPNGPLTPKSAPGV